MFGGGVLERIVARLADAGVWAARPPAHELDVGERGVERFGVVLAERPGPVDEVDAAGAGLDHHGGLGHEVDGDADLLRRLPAGTARPLQRNQPLRRKYRKGAATEATISAMANG